jgi:hypothetical protein
MVSHHLCAIRGHSRFENFPFPALPAPDGTDAFQGIIVTGQRSGTGI